ncbi:MULTISPECIES: DUF736 family protein [Thalassospira]|jgi:uncharacterized protein (DUF736 family)|uniref:DUF736 domain-containing protein n=1 Tax=Thalassospira xiamenensis TaxID=220697 RepID=A0ABR5Y4Y1_9PROT|nr:MULTISPECIES: DUF736 family protein [Thalassospira]MAL30958.1 DUF736 domain-containing protein [Thalassospira sp.]MBR9778986.1 DUF736 domain-containing protein [Rhodospirillales bacterium]KZD05171.1 hypothetical protein AUP40_14210 [Thalassospira xiamenensis]KZD11867.1 hypothetical protein AUP45_01715 [Thalassospira xiamenensis]MBL4843179.1 DUF736 family protein [Thalassospira sp.]|tara:strand:+ start:1225 stop:1605 length:381 start_codon:yes stop_codon:yes gene_type:complete
MNQLKFSDDRKHASGQFSTLHFGLDIEIHAIDGNWDKGKPPVGTGKEPGRPAYDVFGAGRGGAVKLGAAWLKTIQNGPNTGKQFLTMSLDDPSFPSALNLSAFEGDAPGIYNLKWERPRQATQDAA